MTCLGAVVVRGLLVSLRGGFPKVRPSSFRSLRILGWLRLGGALELLPHLPPAQLAQKSRCPNFNCRPGGSDGAGDLIHPHMDSVEVTLLWEHLWLPAALCGEWGRSAQILSVPTFQGAAVTSRKVQVWPLLLALSPHSLCTPSM